MFGLAFLLSIGVRALSGPVQNDGSTLHKATNVIGTTVSGSFLYVIAILSILILVSIVRIFFDMRRGAYDEQQLEEQLNSRGLMNRFLGRHMNKIREPWQMYPLPILFGLGFDTATEIALLVLAAGGLRSLLDRPADAVPVLGKRRCGAGAGGVLPNSGAVRHRRTGDVVQRAISRAGGGRGALDRPAHAIPVLRRYLCTDEPPSDRGTDRR